MSEDQDDLFPEDKAAAHAMARDKWVNYWTRDTSHVIGGRGVSPGVAAGMHKRLFNTTPKEHLSKLYDNGFKEAGYHGDQNSWTENPSNFSHHDDKLSAALRHPGQEIHKDAKVYTGLNWADHRSTAIPLLKPGHEVLNDGFTATSVSRKVAHDFTDEHPKDGTIHLIEWHLPKGYNKGAYVAHFSDHPKEFEYLLDQGTRFRYLGNRVEVHDGFGALGKEKRRVTIHSMEPVDHE